MNAVSCKATECLFAASAAGADAQIATVVGEVYRIFAPCSGIVTIGLTDAAVAANVIGVIGPGGYLDWKATQTTLEIAVVDTVADSIATSTTSTVVVVKISNNA
jgi:hypothetical protein